MTSYYQRKLRSKNSHITAIVIGILFVIGGLYFVFVISGQTNRRNAKCTEMTVGTITDVSGSGSKYTTTIDYTIEDIDKTITVKAKKDLGVGNTIDIYYEPMSFSHLYIEGISETGTHNIITGLIIILIGGVFIAFGILEKRKKGASPLRQRS